MKPASPCTGSRTIAATSSAATRVLNAHSSASRSANGTRYVSGANGPEARLVRMGLRGEAEREQRAAVEGALEGDHGGALRVGARELDRVLDRLGARVEERGARLARDRRELEQALGQARRSSRTGGR